MARNTIVLSNDPRGRFIEGQLATGQTPKPGQCVSIKSDGTYEVWNADAADGERDEVIVLCEDILQGKTVDDAYASGSRFRAYIPLPGDEIQVLAKNLTGTGSGTDDAFAIGNKLIIDDGTGKSIKTTGSPEMEPFKVMETVSALGADTLIMVRRI